MVHSRILLAIASRSPQDTQARRMAWWILEALQHLKAPWGGWEEVRYVPLRFCGAAEERRKR